MAATEIRRQILVPIDLHGINRRALEALVAMAERLGVELNALIVDDSVLEQVAQLPFATEVVRSTGVERRLYADSIQRRRRQLDYRMRALFEEYAHKHKVSVRFEMVQGRRMPTVLGRRGVDVFFPGRPVTEGAFYRRVKLIYDASIQARRAVEIVHALVKNGHTREIFLIAEHRVPTAVLRGLAETGARVYLDQGPATGGLQRYLGRPASDLILMPYSAVEGMPASLLETAFDRSPGSVLVLDAQSPE